MSEPTVDPRILANLEEMTRVIREQGEELERFRQAEAAREREDRLATKADQARRERLGVAVNVLQALVRRQGAISPDISDRNFLAFSENAVRLADALLSRLAVTP